MTSFIIIPHVKLISSTNTKNKCDDCDVIKYIYRIPAIRNILDILCVSSKTKWEVECALTNVAIKNVGLRVISQI